MRNPWLTVVMPTFDGGRYLRHALDSVAAQQDRDIEVIVIDDGSRDDTAEIARTYRNTLSITVHVLPHSGNWVRNTNLGMRLARGAYLSILHQDDAWRPNRLKVLKRLIAEHPDAAMFAHPCWYMDARGRKIGYWRCPFPRGGAVLPPRLVFERLIVQCLYGVAAPLFSAKLAAQAGLMDESLWFSADWDFWLKLSHLGPTVYCPTPLAMFRLHPASQTIVRGWKTDEVYRQQLLVQSRHVSLIGDSAAAVEIRRVARLSTEVNAALLRFLDGEPIGAGSLAKRLLALGPPGWLRYLRDSRIVERCLSRIQAGAVVWRAAAPPQRVAQVGLQIPARRAPSGLTTIHPAVASGLSNHSASRLRGVAAATARNTAEAS
ncbi:MAG TPA: glycosyltransferase [Pirellulales bacterium]|nr:glycosyltransferase [Pirellulales bacterium]